MLESFFFFLISSPTKPNNMTRTKELMELSPNKLMFSFIFYFKEEWVVLSGPGCWSPRAHWH